MSKIDPVSEGSGLVSDDEDYDEGSGDFIFEDSSTIAMTPKVSTATTTILTTAATTSITTTAITERVTSITTATLPSRTTTLSSNQHHGSGHHSFITDDEDLIEGSGLDIDDDEEGSGEVEGSGERAESEKGRQHPPPELDPYEQQRIRTEFYELHHADMYRLDQ